MPLITYHNRCRVCGGKDLESIIYLGEHFLHGLFVYPDFQPPVRKIPTQLMRCKAESGGCGLVQLVNSVDSDILYSRYGYRSSTNATMRHHLCDISNASNLLWISKNQGNPRCLDIGCNDGYLSRQYPSHYEKVGIDPCDVGCSIEGIWNFKFINTIFPSDKLEGEFDIITMIACFYDVNNPNFVAQKLAEKLTKNGVLIIEVSYWPTKMASNAIDEVCHEHVCFYNLQNLEDIFSKAGLQIFNATLNNINGGSIQLWMTRKDSTISYQSPEYHKNVLDIKFNELNLALDTKEPYAHFVQGCFKIKGSVEELFYHIKRNNKTVHLYGASTKGNVLLQFFGLDHIDIPFAAERSKEKFGGMTLGTNIKMISEEESRAMKPDYYFVPIWGFRDEVVVREKEFINNGGKLIFPLPKLEIVEK